MLEAEMFAVYEWVNMMVAEVEENFVDFATVIMTDQERANVDFVDENMVMHDGKGRSVNFVH